MADILIPKVDLPKNQDFIVITVLSDGFAKIETVKDNCIEMRTSKAIELPSHGRLVDAIRKWLSEQHEFSMVTTCKIDKIIEDSPTIVEASND